MANKLRLNNKIIDLVCDLSHMVKSRMSFDSGAGHLTLHQLRTLIFISKKREVRMIDLARNFHITKPSVTALVNGLFENGYLERLSNDKDKREVKVSLAKKGQRLLDQAIKCRSKKISYVLSFISEKDKNNLEIILQTMINKLKEEYENK